MEPFRTNPLLTHARWNGGGRKRPVYVASIGIHLIAFTTLFVLAPAPRVRAVEKVGGFEVAPQAAPAGPRPRSAVDAQTSIEILAKPRPVYSDEARRLRIEGEVVEALGHGLDEAAIAAAKKILFTPARRNGVAVDYTATLRVSFRLA